MLITLSEAFVPFLSPLSCCTSLAHAHTPSIDLLVGLGSFSGYLQPSPLAFDKHSLLGSLEIPARSHHKP